MNGLERLRLHKLRLAKRPSRLSKLAARLAKLTARLSKLTARLAKLTAGLAKLSATDTRLSKLSADGLVQLHAFRRRCRSLAGGGRRRAAAEGHRAGGGRVKVRPASHNLAQQGGALQPHSVAAPESDFMTMRCTFFVVDASFY